MPGLAGIADFSQDAASIKQNIQRMGRILCHTAPSVEDRCVLDHVALSSVRLKAYPFHNLIGENEDTAIAFWGYLWDEVDLMKRTGVEGNNLKDISLGQLLLKLHKKEGLEGFCNLNGRFVIALWDKGKKTLVLINDRYGFCKLFYWLTSKRILFASEYKAIVWHESFPKKIDKIAVSDFFSIGFSTGDRTFFEHVKLLPPASIATFKMDGSFSIKKYWDYSFHSEDEPVWTEEHYVDQFFELLTKAIKKQIGSTNNIGLPLSGGLDSRTLAGILHKLGLQREVKTFSYGNPYCFDVKYGMGIAKKLGFEHSYLPIESTYLRDNAERFVWLAEDTVSCLNAHMLLTYPFIRKNSLETIMTGFFGDTICGSGSYLDGIQGETDDELILKKQYGLQEIMKDEDMAVYANEDFYSKVRGATFEAVRSRYFQCHSKDKFFRTRYFLLYERQRRFTSFNLYMFDFVGGVLSPFVDHDFVEFILHVPSVLMLDRNLYMKMIVKHLPEVASVPYNNTRLPLNASWIRKGLHWRWESLTRNSLIRATIGRKYTRLHDNYLMSGEAIRTGSRDFVEKSIRNNKFLAEFFKIDRVNRLLDDHMNGKAHEPGKITALLTLALWGKMFVENEKPTFK